MFLFLNNFQPQEFALVILFSASLFSVLWGFDALTHKKLVKIDITDKELQTHRNILLVSVLMEISLISMFWNPLVALPVFIALFITRFSHEFIDELHYHTGRCKPYENYLHIGMWVSVLTKTFAMFLWGFCFQYNGVVELPFYIYIWAGIVLISMMIIGFFEWKR
ncbi:MAG: hypothetical protein P8L23_01250 [Flavobacteriales bacterium]|nr:hypothetical protein [Flavobacteriales bacterium]